MLGSALTAQCEKLGVVCRAYAEADLDITDAEAVDAAAAHFAAQDGVLMINAAAYTDVERAEDEEERAFAVNDTGARNVARAAARQGLGFVHVSTDFVFDGASKAPYTEKDEPHPLNAYGRSKLAGERSVLEVCPTALLVRTAWVYGLGGSNFPLKIIELARRREEIQVVNDEFGSPTASIDLARGILELRRLRATGLFNLTGSGSCSRYELAREIVSAAGLSTRVLPVGRGFFPSKAVRPANSVLSMEKARRLGVEMPPWAPSLRAFVQQHLSNAV
jgi:dTDP-4-dehydrorhamnose reductase